MQCPAHSDHKWVMFKIEMTTNKHRLSSTFPLTKGFLVAISCKAVQAKDEEEKEATPETQEDKETADASHLDQRKALHAMTQSNLVEYNAWTCLLSPS